MPLYPVMQLHAVRRLFDNVGDGSRKSITWEMAVTRIGRRNQSTGAIRGCGGVADNPQCGHYALFTDVMFILGFKPRYACFLYVAYSAIEHVTPIAQTSGSHFGLVVSAPAWDGTGCKFDSRQCRIYIPCSLSLYDYLGLFGVLWIHMAWHKNCVKLC